MLVNGDCVNRKEEFAWPMYVPDHGDANRPGCIADRKTKIRIVRFLILTTLHEMHYLGNACQHVRRKRLHEYINEVVFIVNGKLLLPSNAMF